MKMKNLLLMIGGILLLIVATVAATYAYFTANLSTSETETSLTVTGGTMQINYDSSKTINISNTFPKDGAIDTKVFTVTGTNTTGANMYYDLSLIVKSNSFSTGTLTYSLSGSKTEPTGTLAPAKTNQPIPAGSQNISLGQGSYVGAGSSIVHTYTLTMFFPKTSDSGQNVEQGKTFNGYIDIKAANV